MPLRPTGTLVTPTGGWRSTAGRQQEPIHSRLPLTAPARQLYPSLPAPPHRPARPDPTCTHRPPPPAPPVRGRRAAPARGSRRPPKRGGRSRHRAPRSTALIPQRTRRQRGWRATASRLSRRRAPLPTATPAAAATAAAAGASPRAGGCWPAPWLKGQLGGTSRAPPGPEPGGGGGGRVRGSPGPCQGAPRGQRPGRPGVLPSALPTAARLLPGL